MAPSISGMFQSVLDGVTSARAEREKVASEARVVISSELALALTQLASQIKEASVETDEVSYEDLSRYLCG